MTNLASAYMTKATQEKAHSGSAMFRPRVDNSRTKTRRVTVLTSLLGVNNELEKISKERFVG
jgi:hypothetical protein